MIVWLLVALASAAPPAPTVEVGEEGNVIGRVELAVAPEVLIERLWDPTWLPTVDQGGTEITLLRTEGACQVLDAVSPSAVMTVRYRIRNCRLPDGYEATLIESDTFTSYRTRWTIVPSGAGSQATYDLDARTNLWIPRGIIRSQTRSAVQRLLTNLQAWAAAEAGG